MSRFCRSLVVAALSLLSLAGGAALAQENPAKSSFDAFQAELPKLHGLVIGLGRRHSMVLFSDASLRNEDELVVKHLKLTKEQAARFPAEREKVRREQSQADAPAPNAPPGARFAARDAVFEQALANVLTAEQRERAFELLLFTEGATAVMADPLAPAELQLTAAQKAAIAQHEATHFTEALRKQLLGTFDQPPDATREEQQELARRIAVRLDQAVWNELTQPQRDLLVKIAQNVSAAKKQRAADESSTGDKGAGPRKS